jgi:hypothetical protein
MTMTPPSSRLQVAQLLASHLGHSDFDKFVELLSPDVTYRVGGNHALAGTFRGPDEVLAHIKRLVGSTGETYDAFKWEDWLVGDNHVAALVRVHARGRGAIYVARLVVLFGFDPTNKVSEITIFFEDVSGAERFFTQ